MFFIKHKSSLSSSARNKARKAGEQYGCVNPFPLLPPADLKNKRETHRQWKQGHTSCKQYRNAAQTCRDEITITKEQLELNLGRDVKKKKITRASTDTLIRKGKTKENELTSSFISDKETAKVLSSTASVFLGGQSSRISQIPKTKGRPRVKYLPS